MKTKMQNEQSIQIHRERHEMTTEMRITTKIKLGKIGF